MAGMKRALPRTSFNSSGLVRLLADLAAAGGADAKQSFAERMGLWLGFIDAIALSAALNANAGGPDSRPDAPSGADDAVHGELARVRAALIDSISAGKARTKLPTPAPGATIDSAADFSPYRRYYLALQRDMEASIGPLRDNVRSALAGKSPALKRLGALDAALDKALSERERSLLATVPGLLEKRFEHLRQAHRAALAASGAADDPELWLRPGGWLAAFCKDMQNLLLAELELRLQPVIGLIEAFGNEVTPQQ
jgi:hypothetical protein